MTRPEDALERAREAAGRKRSEGAYGEAAPPGQAAGWEVEPPSTEAALRERALIEVNPDIAYSTRRLGAPITALKRGLLRILLQYNTELQAQQTRFNVTLLGYVRELEQRVAELERGRPGSGNRE